MIYKLNILKFKNYFAYYSFLIILYVYNLLNKMRFIIITLFLCYLNLIESTLYFELSDKPKCYIDEFFLDTIAVIKFKIIVYKGLEDDTLDGNNKFNN